MSSDHHRDRARPRARHSAAGRRAALRRARGPGPLPHRLPFRRGVEATGAQHIPLPPRRTSTTGRTGARRSPSAPRSRGQGDRLRHRARLRAPRPRPARRDHGGAPDEPADVLLADPAFAGGAFLLGHPLGERPPIVVCGVVPLTIASRDTAPYGMGLTPLRGPLGRLRNALLSALAARTVFPARSGWPARSTASCTGGHCRSRSWTGRGTPRRSCSSPCPSSSTRDPTPRRPCTSSARSRPPARRRRCRRGGTTSTARGPSSTSPRARSPTATTGRSSPRPSRRSPTTTCSSSCPPADARSTRLPPLPANARAAEYLPYDELLPRTDVFVTNGGYGGVQYALRYGVPIVTSSGQEDKPEVAARIAWSGVGRRLKTGDPVTRSGRRRGALGAPRPALPGARASASPRAWPTPVA